MCSRSSGFGMGYGISQNYRPIWVSVSVSDRNQNSDFGRSLISPQLYLNQPLLPTEHGVETDLQMKLGQSHMICVQKIRVKKEE